MRLVNLLHQRKTAILERWLKLILETYPSDASSFLEKQKNRFANPVGYTLSTETSVLIEAILEEIDSETLSTSLNNILKIRSVQEFSPSQAVGFIFYLKKAMIDELGDEIRVKDLYDELIDVEARIDALVLRAFECYMKCREELYQVRTRELQRKTNIILSRYSHSDQQEDQDN